MSEVTTNITETATEKKISNLEEAVSFVDTHVEETNKGNLTTLKFDASRTNEFFELAGVSTEAQNQYREAQTLLYRAIYDVTGNRFVKAIKGNGTPLSDAKMVTTFSEGKNAGSMSMSGKSVKSVPQKDGTSIQAVSYGSGRMVVRTSKHILDEDMKKLSDALKELDN